MIDPVRHTASHNTSRAVKSQTLFQVTFHSGVEHINAPTHPLVCYRLYGVEDGSLPAGGEK